MAFVRANGIELEDVCVFELVRKCEMRVHILGAAQGRPDCQSVKNFDLVRCQEYCNFTSRSRKCIKEKEKKIYESQFTNCRKGEENASRSLFL